MPPLVSVICLCFNHERFVREALRSVFQQTYPNIQIIIVDDASTDQSMDVIRNVVGSNADVQIVSLDRNIGNCAAFNRGLALARGKYIIDFATDDVMHFDRIAHQVAFFESHDDSWGVNFTDATYIDPDGKFIRDHFDYLLEKKLLMAVPEGDVYTTVLSTYFIPSPTMMIRKSVLDELNGYDESLAYEDFDFWVRASRNYKFSFLNERSTLIRRKHGSMSDGWYMPGDRQLHSTYLICKKAVALNRTQQDRDALLKRLRYELRQSVFSENHTEAGHFFALIKEMGAASTTDRLLHFINGLHLPLSRLRSLYQKIRY
ncbi:glycosyltransferase family 2 protein [Pseudochryseolinea flava]|uniref:Glycosyl transferase n=1 Tax=Pseudochryseolinea flava TaxID=2059302 RepID=A0A364XXC5_9BACT|nr:glycosyltransferase [Pseudochryseolinea flava]RAV99094.1 glycosyl transferase [Pseudochryseolinea flava]